MFDVITIGSATRDIFVRSSALDIHASDVPLYTSEACFPVGAKIDMDELVFETGGGATNAAVTFARLGCRTATVCTVGDDANGRDIIEALESESVDTKFVTRTDGLQTGCSIIILAGSGERTILVHRGASAKCDAEALPWKKIRAKWFYVSSLGGDIALMRHILDHAETNGIKVAWNPGNGELKFGLAALEPLIRKTDVFNLNREEAAMLTGLPPADLNGIIAKLRNLPKRVLLVTDGPGGTYTAEGDETWHSGIIDVPRVNTTGAGDAFGSGFVAGLLKRDDVRYGLIVGTWNATNLVQHMGAKRGLIRKYPAREEEEKISIERWG